MTPFSGVAHDNSATLLVVLGNAEFHDSCLAGDSQLLVNFVLDGQSMSVPAEATLNMEALHGPITGDDILDCGGQKMAIMGQSGCKGRSIVESVSRAALGEFNLLLLEC